ncbi:MAG TPA: hypothetical protein VIA18_30310 [Polyangia bacterium]|nr:hypothetical protein [Polyangia bacterium]
MPRAAGAGTDDRLAVCESRWEQWDSARIVGLLAASTSLASFVAQHAHEPLVRRPARA